MRNYGCRIYFRRGKEGYEGGNGGGGKGTVEEENGGKAAFPFWSMDFIRTGGATSGAKKQRPPIIHINKSLQMGTAVTRGGGKNINSGGAPLFRYKLVAIFSTFWVQPSPLATFTVPIPI